MNVGCAWQCWPAEAPFGAGFASVLVGIDAFDSRVNGVVDICIFREEEDRPSSRPGHAVLARPTQRHRIEEPWMAPAWKR